MSQEGAFQTDQLAACLTEAADLLAWMILTLWCLLTGRTLQLNLPGSQLVQRCDGMILDHGETLVGLDAPLTQEVIAVHTSRDGFFILITPAALQLLTLSTE